MKIQHTIMGYYHHRKTGRVFVVLKLPDDFEPHKAGWMRRPELDEDGSQAWELPDGRLCRHRLTEKGRSVYNVPVRDPQWLRKFHNGERPKISDARI